MKNLKITALVAVVAWATFFVLRNFLWQDMPLMMGGAIAIALNCLVGVVALLVLLRIQAVHRISRDPKARDGLWHLIAKHPMRFAAPALTTIGIALVGFTLRFGSGNRLDSPFIYGGLGCLIVAMILVLCDWLTGLRNRERNTR